MGQKLFKLYCQWLNKPPETRDSFFNDLFLKIDPFQAMKELVNPCLYPFLVLREDLKLFSSSRPFSLSSSREAMISSLSFLSS